VPGVKVGHDKALDTEPTLDRPRPSLDGQPASRVQLPPGEHASLLDGLCARFPAVSRDQWLDRLQRGRVLDAGHRPFASDAPYRAGAQVHYFREVADEVAIPFEEVIVHADQDLVVADKPHFLPVAPTGAWARETLLTRLVQRLGNPDLVPLHRIDRGTAGLVLFSARRSTRAAYQALFRERRIDKGYEALAPALPGLEWPLRRETRLVRGEPFFRMAEQAGMANAVTLIEPITADGPVWRYRLIPLTGRKHQLRVHMAGLGAPLLGDRVYPVLQPQADDDPDLPLQLVARRLDFDDPLSGVRRSFTSDRSLMG